MSNPVISALSYTVTDTTIVATWTTDISADSNLFAGGKAAIDNGVAANSTSHQAIVTGLTPNTLYSCHVVSGATTSASSNQTTSAAHTSTPIRNVAYGTPTITQNDGDDTCTFVSDDDNTYIVEDDGHGFVQGTPNAGANMQIGVLTNEATLVGTTVNLLTAYGGMSTFNGTDGPGGNPLSNKQTGLFGMAGDLYMFQNRSYGPAGGNTYEEFFGNIMRSTDKGVTWNSWQAPSTYNANGVPPSPLGSYQFATGGIGAVMPVRYAKDDGTLGYNTAGNQQDGANGFVYMTFVDTGLINNDNLYLMRMPRISMQQQDGTAVTYWHGPASPTSADFVNDSNWSATYAGSTAIYNNTGKVSWSFMTFIPALNRYLLPNWYYAPTKFSSASGESIWEILEAPTPAGPWTLVSTKSNPVACWFAPAIQHRTAAENVATSDVALQFIFSGDYVDNFATYYHPTYRTLTLNPSGVSMVELIQDDFLRANENPLANGHWSQIDSGVLGALQVASDLCEPAVAATNCMMYWSASDGTTDTSWAADQYSEITLQATMLGGANQGFAGPAVRCSATGGYMADFQGGGAAGLIVYKRSGGAFTSIHTAVGPFATNAGDVFRLQVVGTTLTTYRNGVSIDSFTDSTFASGNPGIYLNGAHVADAKLSLFAAGSNQCAIPTFSPVAGSYTGAQTVTISSDAGTTIYYTTDGSSPTHSSSSFATGGTVVISSTSTLKAVASKTDLADSAVGSAAFTINAATYSVPDCRNSTCGLVPTVHVYPNGHRTVQGTLIYDVETSNNAAVPGTDSRTAGAPVDSRVASIIPVNSRTPGTFGPGE